MTIGAPVSGVPIPANPFERPGDRNATTDQTYAQAVVARDDAARGLYRAEIAVHDARQAHVDQWISAANDRLHIAVPLLRR